MLATTPSGSWPIRSLMPPSLNTVSSLVAASTSARKKSIRARKPFSSLRDCASGLPTSCVSVAASVSSSVDDGETKARDRDRPLGERRRLPRRLRLARALGLPGDARGVVGRDLGDQRAVGGIGDLQLASCGAGGARRGEEVVEQRPVVERAFAPAVELGVPLHRGHDTSRRAGGSPRSCRRSGSAPRRRSRARGP